MGRAGWIFGKIFKGIFALIFMAAFALAFGFGVTYLWNWLVPNLFHGPVIAFWQAVGLIVLARLLVGFGRGGGCGPFGGWRGRMGGWGRHHHGRGDWQSRRDYWSYYHDYWKERGESDFEAYVKERKEKGNKEDKG